MPTREVSLTDTHCGSPGVKPGTMPLLWYIPEGAARGFLGVHCKAMNKKKNTSQRLFVCVSILLWMGTASPTTTVACKKCLPRLLLSARLSAQCALKILKNTCATPLFYRRIAQVLCSNFMKFSVSINHF